MEDLTKARQLSPREVEQLRREVKAAVITMVAARNELQERRGRDNGTCRKAIKRLSFST